MFGLDKDWTTSGFRIERKFSLTGMLPDALPVLLQQHPAGFRKHHPDRWVNSLYFDDEARTAYFDNLRGVHQRQKLRLRWYGDLRGGTVYQLELKERRNEANRKHTRLVLEIDPRDWPAGRQALQQFIRGPWQEPLLGVRYHRSYWLSANGAFRLTIDRQLHYFYPPHRSAARPRPMEGVILEIKHALEDDERAKPLYQAWPFRPTRHSKYVRGMQLLY